jgi:hypothetical protein
VAALRHHYKRYNYLEVCALSFLRADEAGAGITGVGRYIRVFQEFFSSLFFAKHGKAR